MDIHGSVVHYDYTAFGVAIVSTLSENPVGFSSEFYDISLGLVYYNYRHYNPKDGRWNARDLLATDSLGISPIIFCLNSPLSYNDRFGLYQYETISSHSVSILSVLGGDIPGLSNLTNKFNEKLKINWLQLSTSWSLNGSVTFERRKCCEGPHKGEEVVDEIWAGSLSGTLEFSAYSHRGDFISSGVEVEYWFGAKGTLSGSISGSISGESDKCSGRDVTLNLGVTASVGGSISGGGSVSAKVGKLLSFSLSATAGLEAHINYTFWARKYGAKGWETVASGWDDFSVNFFVNADFTFASYYYEKKLY